MDFQLARNLSALSRAQHEAAEALLHIDCLADCINREIIMSAASSEATEQLVISTRATLVQLQNILATQSTSRGPGIFHHYSSRTLLEYFGVP